MKQPISPRQRERFYRESRSKTAAGTAPASSNGAAGTSHDGSASKGKPDRRKRWHYLREYFRWLWPYRFQITILFLLALFGAGLDMVWPMAIKWIVDTISGGPGGSVSTGMPLPLPTGPAATGLPAAGAPHAAGGGLDLHRLNVIGCWVI